MKLIIDATRNRSGGIVSYVKNLLEILILKKQKLMKL